MNNAPEYNTKGSKFVSRDSNSNTDTAVPTALE